MDNNVSAILDNYRNQINSVLNRPNSLDAILRRGAVADQLAYGAPTGGVEIPEFDGMPLAMGGQPVGAQGLQDLMTMVSHAGSGILGDETTPPNWGQIYGQRAQQQIEEQKMLDAREIAKTDAINKAVSENKAIKAQMAQKGVDAILKEADLEIEQDQIKSSLMSTLFTGGIAADQNSYERMSKGRKEMYDIIKNAVGTKEQQYSLSMRLQDIIKERGLDEGTLEAMSHQQKVELVNEGITSLKGRGVGGEAVETALSGVDVERDLFPLDAPTARKTMEQYDPDTRETYRIDTETGEEIGGTRKPQFKPTQRRIITKRDPDTGEQYSAYETGGEIPDTRGPDPGYKGISSAAADDIRKMQSAQSKMSDLNDTFKPEFTGRSLLEQGYVAIDQATGLSKYTGTDEDTNMFWMGYSSWVNAVRNAEFGASLTASELAAFNKVRVHPGMDASLVRRHLQKQTDIVNNAINKEMELLMSGNIPPQQKKILEGRRIQPGYSGTSDAAEALKLRLKNLR